MNDVKRESHALIGEAEIIHVSMEDIESSEVHGRGTKPSL